MPTLLVIDDEPNVLYSLEASLPRRATRWSPPPPAGRASTWPGAGRPTRSSWTSGCPTCPGWRPSTRSGGIDPRLPVDPHDRLRRHRDGHRGDEARRVRVPAQAGRPAPAARRARPGRRAAPAAARAGRVRPGGARPAARRTAIVGRSPAMQEVYKAIGRVAPQDVTVLILGESGTGKELVARALYQHSAAGRQAVPGDQLRGHPREPAGERAVRPREGRVHRGRPPAHRQVRAGRRRHAVPRRDRRHERRPPRPRCCACSRSSASSASAATRRSGSTCA